MSIKGEVVTEEATYDPNAFAGDTSVFTPVNAQNVYNPKTQHIGGKGTTVFNMKPSDPRYEAIHGERRYKEKPKEHDPNVQRDKVEKLQQQVEMLTQMLAGKVAKEEAPEPADTKAEEAPDTSDEDVTNTVYDMSYSDLVKEAKKIDPSIKGRPPKDKVVAIVNKHYEEQAEA